MRRRFVPAMVLLVGLATAGLGDTPPAAVPAALADVAFLAGHWVGGEDGAFSEEVWSAPEGDSMMGMWRYVEKGEARIYELLTLTVEGSSVALRIRHFDPKLVAREEKDRPVLLLLVVKAPGEAVFEGPQSSGKGTVRIGYRKEKEGTLIVVVEKNGSREEFRFRRQ